MSSQVEVVEEFTKLAMTYGPFFFAVFIFVWASRTFRKRYNQAVRDHPDNQEFVRHAKRQDSIVLYLGISIVIVCIVWWFFASNELHVIAGKFEDIKDYEQITSESIYLKSEPLKKIADNLPQLRNEYFLAVVDPQAGEDAIFSIRYSKGPKHEVRLPLDCTEGKSNCFKIIYDPQERKNRLVRCGQKQGQNKFNWFSPQEAFAHDTGKYTQPPLGNIHPPASQGPPTPSPKQRPLMLAKSASPQEITTYLADERSGVGQKIWSLDILLSCRTCLAECLAAPAKNEPFILTVYDLTKHTDPELSAMAREVFRKINAPQYLVNSLKYGTMSAQTVGEVLLRMDKPLALKTGQHIVRNTGNPIIKQLVIKIERGQLSPMNLIPTGTREGDRYYVKAIWDRRNEKTISCLTKLFNSALISQRTSAQERELMNKMMEKRNYRVVYWYSKSWALQMARSIERCGAQAEFVAMGR